MSTKLFYLVMVMGTVFTLSSHAGFSTKKGRGSIAEYDPGPKKDSLWIPMFGSVPNYRAIGKKYTGKEKFRWNIGPMWYRGRLGAEQVKVLVVGQEGAQDENTSNRTFTGGTGTKTQNMLRAFGMDRSYLFLNTFVYTIFGQRDTEDKNYMEMEQSLDSPIVVYRHQLMDYAAQYNKDTLSMLVAVGGGARDSLLTWIKARGGRCSSYDPNSCDTSKVKIYTQEFGEQNKENEAGLVSLVPGVRYTNKTVKLKNTLLVTHVPHPGMARFPGGGAAVAKGFKRAAERMTRFVKKNKNWLDGRGGRPKPDIGTTNDIVKNLNKFQYKNSPVPHRDFAFATTWRLGDGGTNTTRDGQSAIVIRSASKEYGSRGKHDKSTLGKGNRDGRNQNKGRPWEPPVWDPRNPQTAKNFDYGPCGYVGPRTKPCQLAQLMTSWPDFTKTTPKVDQSDSFGLGRVYRGNPRGAKVVVLAHQYSTDAFFMTRVLSGETGQRLQTWLEKNGYNNDDSNKKNDYVIVRTLPVDTSTMNRKAQETLATDTKVVAQVKKILDRVKALSGQANVGKVRFVALGSIAKKVSEKLSGYSFESLSSRDLPNALTDIALADRPYSTRYFMGTTGNRATTDSGQYYRFQAPQWVVKTPIPRD